MERKGVAREGMPVGGAREQESGSGSCEVIISLYQGAAIGYGWQDFIACKDWPGSAIWRGFFQVCLESVESLRD